MSYPDVDMEEKRRQAQGLLGKADIAVKHAKQSFDKRTTKYRQHTTTTIRKRLKGRK